jgi:hypothetical protein
VTVSRKCLIGAPVEPNTDIVDAEWRTFERKPVRPPMSGRGLAIFVLGTLAFCGLLVAALTSDIKFPSYKGSAPVAVEVQIPPSLPDPRLLDVAPEEARTLNSDQPLVAGGVVPARPFVFTGSPISLARAIDCLAAATWYEAGDDARGQRAVAQVIVNRALNPAFPASICRVVFQGSERRTGCQFTFACDGAMTRTPSEAAWRRARTIAAGALGGVVDGSVGYATHYHTDWVVPYWRATLDKIAQVNTHLFYRWKGYWGTPAAFVARRNIVRDEPIVPPLARLSPVHAGSDGETLELPLLPVVDRPSATPGPPPVEVKGISDQALRGATVRGRPTDNLFLIKVEPTSLPGGYATTALALCKGFETCRVLGWREADSIPVSMPLSASQAGQLTFAYVRTPAGDLALWNCTQVERSKKSQCLPGDPAGIVALSAGQ